MSSERLLISEKEAGLRLDKLLAEHYAHHSRAYFQSLIENGYVLVNGNRLKKREKPKIGDEIETCFVLTPGISLEPEEIPLDILYEDEHLLAVNKPAGMVVHPAPGHPSQTFVNALLFHCKQLGIGDNLRPGIVHRLDKDTSGVLIAAKTAEAHAKLVALFSSRQIEKNYLAVCLGTPGNTTIDAPLRRHPVHRKQMAVCPEGGKEAISRCTVLAVKEQLALVNVQIITGRTHQIRAHLKSHGTPVIGDPVYGSAVANQKYGISRQLLHAHRLEFIHPITKQSLVLSAPLPSDLVHFLKKYQLD